MSAEINRIRKMQTEKKQRRSSQKIVLIAVGTLLLAGAVAAVVVRSAKPVDAREDSTVLHDATANDQYKENDDASRPRTPVEYRINEVPMEYVASQGELLFLNGGKKLLLPLMHTDVTGRVDGYLARVKVTQKFVNLFDSTIEAIYTFPLPENAAVDSMIMTIGDRRIKGIIKEKGEARAIYEQARRDGKTASLLEQERPNIFTQSVANILKGDTILVTISYVQELKFQNGSYAFNFPMVVGPRYIPGAAIKPATNGTVNPTSQVPDADKITPPLLPPGLRSGHDIALSLTINAGSEITELSSASHKTSDRTNGDKTRTISILSSDNIPNKDFTVEYSVAKKEISTVVLTHRQNNDGFFQLMMLPKVATSDKEIFARELVFVVDNSGSMDGLPTQECKKVIGFCLKKMRRNDVFRIVKFAGYTHEMSPIPLAATSENISNAVSFVEDMSGGEGVKLISVINAIFDAPQIKNRRRHIIFLTDGYIGTSAAILDTIRNKLGSSRVFVCGVGSSVNRSLIEGMAYNGRGRSMFMQQDGDAEKAMEEFYSYIDAPVLTDIEVKFNNVKTSETTPYYLPDLFAGQPLIITGKYGTPGSGTLAITGNLPRGRKYSTVMEITLPREESANGVIATLWARKKIKELELRRSEKYISTFSPYSVKEQVTKLGLAYRISTNFTSFVALDNIEQNDTFVWPAIVHKIDLPQAVDTRSLTWEQYAKGDPRAPKPTGRLGIITGYLSGKTVEVEDLLKKNEGFTGNVDELIAMAVESGGKLKKKGTLRIFVPISPNGCPVTGARSKASIIRVIMENLAAIRYAYTKRLREKPDLKGSIVVKVAIDQFGKVIFCIVAESTMNDPQLETIIIEKIKLWQFEKIDKPGDVSEIVYPFVFSQ